MKYKMFVNYRDPFDNLDLEMENQVSVKLNDYMNMTFMLHMIYDDNIMFPVYDNEGTKVGEKAKLQLKEFLTLGFSYKISKKVMRTRRVR